MSEITPNYAKTCTVFVDPDVYAIKLLERAGEAVVCGRILIENRDWQPQANMCHHNVTTCCELHPEFKIVRGWLYFDLPNYSYAKFVAHSVVRAPDGELGDITPSNTFQDYPFLVSGLTEEEYAYVVEELGNQFLHAPKIR
ncbi:MAG TPA: hypothetical protein VK949_00675 [Methylotenera sp.]|nr:hypothetical protein [Methylotenera sp.]